MLKKLVLSLLCFVFAVSTFCYAATFEPDWDHKGPLDSLEQDYIIVSDSRYKLSSMVRFLAFSEKYVTRGHFKNGSKVVLTLNEDKSEVIAVWLDDKELP
ncbi:hypothetical protein [uncultured Desulfuromusa sp.]|uniref:hypothetical protein n=1 Tax=uncultured Desulfuromusa sp. TaxID=219183 RepID=UPI002AA7AE62|nr:hypothetical protein [uncultured Desulfuromusa sp.]